MTHNSNNEESKKFTCSICDKKFNRLSNLKDHLTTHSDFKPYQCLVCLKEFSNSSNLSKHRQLHNVKKNFSCLDCDRKFSQKVHLQKHLTRVHGVKSTTKKPNLKPIILSNELIAPPNNVTL